MISLFEIYKQISYSMYSNEQLNAIYSSKIGFEFEFFAKTKLDEVKESLANTLNKKIRIEGKAHSDFSPTYDTFKLEPDNSGGTGMIELVTGSLPFPEAKLLLSKTLNWIKKHGYTNDRCSIHVNISFDLSKLGPSANISNLDIGKFVLNFDEDKVYKEFPNRKDSVYAKSIKFIMPLSGMTQPSPGKNIWKNYMFVNEKYYGVNFTKVPKGYIEFRYLGGKDYEKRYDSILSLMEHFIVSLYTTLDDPKYNKEDLAKLDEVLRQHRDVIQSYKNYEIFKRKFPKITLMVDLKTQEQIIETFYIRVRDKIFELLTKSGMDSGLINYDSDSGRVQVKDVDLSQCFEITGVDIVESTIQGNVKNCDVFDCTIKNSSIFESNLFGVTECSDSKIEDSYVSKNVIVNNSYVFGDRGVFSGEMKGGIFRKGRATKLAKFSDNTEIIEIEKINL
jgi:hypothetical protein